LKKYNKIAILLVLQLFCFHENIIAQDTLSVSKPPRRVFKAEPLRATMLAIAFPGMGQIYNKKYWKVPIVYAGFGGVIFAMDYNSSRYITYLKAYQDLTDAIPETASYLDLPGLKDVDPSTYDPVLHPETYKPSDYSWYKDRMLRMVDYFKKYRDLSYIGIAAWYLLTILDANVDASLFDYDVSDNLDLEVKPVIIPVMSQAVPGLNLSLKVTF
jgi:hypothetical protein